MLLVIHLRVSFYFHVHLLIGHYIIIRVAVLGINFNHGTRPETEDGMGNFEVTWSAYPTTGFPHGSPTMRIVSRRSTLEYNQYNAVYGITLRRLPTNVTSCKSFDRMSRYAM